MGRSNRLHFFHSGSVGTPTELVYTAIIKKGSDRKLCFSNSRRSIIAFLNWSSVPKSLARKHFRRQELGNFYKRSLLQKFQVLKMNWWFNITTITPSILVWQSQKWNVFVMLSKTHIKTIHSYGACIATLPFYPELCPILLQAVTTYQRMLDSSWRLFVRTCLIRT